MNGKARAATSSTTRLLQAALLVMAAVAIRAWLWGNPVIHSDEQFYLLVGDRILDGAWPYVDIFDRKPVGLFLIYAALCAVGGDGVLAYQIAATLAAAGTAFLVTRLASRFASAAAALGAGLCYLVWLVIYDGIGGQSAVWGNALMTAAALLVLDGTPDRERLTRRGVGAMLLVGAAMQIKYTALFEGMFFGCSLLWTGWRSGRTPARLSHDAALWIAAALLPTAMAMAAYFAAGHGDAFVFANFVSIFGQRDDDTALSDLANIAGGGALAAPLAWLAWKGRRRNGFALAWTGAALAAVAIMGRWELFYFIPVAPALSVAAAAGLDNASGVDRRRLIAVVLVGVAAAATLTVLRVARRGATAQVAQLSRLIGQRPSGCLFVFGSEPVLYHLTRSCLPTPYLFRSHLTKSIEADGIGVDQAAEVRRILARRPGVIAVRAPKQTTNPASYRVVSRALAAGYRLVGTVRVGSTTHAIYRLRTAQRAQES